MGKINLINALEAALADSYALYVKTQYYHWNITGPEFYSLHKLFEEQYQDLAEAIDNIAERIRMLGSKVQGSLKAFQKLTTLKEGISEQKGSAMLKDLVKDQSTMLKTLQAALKHAQKEHDEVTTDLLISRMSAHEKNRWMLESSL